MIWFVLMFCCWIPSLYPYILFLVVWFVLMFCCWIPSLYPCRSVWDFKVEKILKPKAKKDFQRWRPTLYYYCQRQLCEPAQPGGRPGRQRLNICLFDCHRARSCVVHDCHRARRDVLECCGSSSNVFDYVHSEKKDREMFIFYRKKNYVVRRAVKVISIAPAMRRSDGGACNG